MVQKEFENWTELNAYIEKLETLLGKIKWESLHDNPQERGVTLKCIQDLLKDIEPIAPSRKHDKEN
jgi:hypothetical protein